MTQHHEALLNTIIEHNNTLRRHAKFALIGGAAILGFSIWGGVKLMQHNFDNIVPALNNKINIAEINNLNTKNELNSLHNKTIAELNSLKETLNNLQSTSESESL